MKLEKKCDIFISYKRKNSKVVFKLVEKLEKELGVKCWIDYTGIETAAQFRSIICKAIDASKIVLFMHSKAHLDIDYEEDYTIKELNYAQQKEKPVCLIKLDEAPLDNIFLFEYGSKNYIDYKDKQQVKKLFADLRQFLDIESKPIPNPPMPNPKPGPNPPIPNPIVKRWIYSIACLTICVVIAGVLGYFREYTEEPTDSTIVRMDSILVNEKHEHVAMPSDTDTNNERYEGDIKNGKRNGKGTLYIYGEKYYEGEWKDDMFHGQGIRYYDNGTTYNGSWVEGIKEGYGVEDFQVGCGRYEGQWHNNKQHGLGTYYDEGWGIKYVGQWKNGKKEGEHLYYWKGETTPSSVMIYKNGELISQRDYVEK